MRNLNIVNPPEPKACPKCDTRLVYTEAGLFCVSCKVEFFECDRCSQFYLPEGICDLVLYCWSCRVKELEVRRKKYRWGPALFKFRRRIRQARHNAHAFPALQLGTPDSFECQGLEWRTQVSLNVQDLKQDLKKLQAELEDLLFEKGGRN